VVRPDRTQTVATSGAASYYTDQRQMDHLPWVRVAIDDFAIDDLPHPTISPGFSELTRFLPRLATHRDRDAV
jgi:hypothetical protein